MDQVTPALISLGYEILDKRFRDEPDGMLIGKRVRLTACEITYRVEEKGAIMILDYSRRQEAQGLGNAFRDFLWFLDFLYREKLGIKWIIGYVDAQPSEFERTLTSNRITQFYLKFLCARVMQSNEGHKWIGSVKRMFGGQWVIGDLELYANKKSIRSPAA